MGVEWGGETEGTRLLHIIVASILSLLVVFAAERDQGGSDGADAPTTEERAP